MKKTIAIIFSILLVLISALIAYNSTHAGREKRQKEAWGRYRAIAHIIEKDQTKPAEKSVVFENIAIETKLLSRYIYDNDKKGELLSLRAEALGLDRRVYESESTFEEAIRLSPKNYLIHFRFGFMQYSNREYEKALRQFGKALSLVPEWKAEERVKIYYLQGKTLEELKRYDYAQLSYAAAVKTAENYHISNDYYELSKKQYEEIDKE